MFIFIRQTAKEICLENPFVSIKIGSDQSYFSYNSEFTYMYISLDRKEGLIIFI